MSFAWIPLMMFVITFGLSMDYEMFLLSQMQEDSILVDATLIRMVLVPAVMELLGDRAWWMPAWLERRLPRLTIESEHAHA